MSVMLADVIRTFILDPNAFSVNGTRRMGRSELMDAVQIILLEFYPDSKIVRFDDGDQFHPDSIVGADMVLITDPHIVSDVVTHLDPDILLFSTQELCHQVPVCIKGSHCLDTCKM